ncbi:MAG: glycosyl hydrolase family 28-related protein [Bacteroidales bacterium]|nr:glycosyl hydrolase family 28-related protein [Bacteroidales bacterium]
MTLLKGQIIPAHRTMDWRIAGSDYNFQTAVQSVDVLNFGAVGNGITDDHAAIVNAVNSFGGMRGVVFFPAGTYLINGSLALPDSVTLRGSGADSTVLIFNSGENNDAINISGSVSGAFVNVIDGFNKNSRQITLGDSGMFASGDVVELIQDGHLHMTSAWAMNCLGQILIIDSVDGNIIYLKHALRMNYDSVLNPRIALINPRKAVSIECLKIQRVDSTTSQTSNIKFNYAFNCKVLGVESHSCNFAHIEISKSTNITIKNSFLTAAHSYGDGGKAYGVCIHATSGACLVENNIFKQLRHAMLLQSGANGNVFTYNYSKDPFWTGVSLPSNSAGDMVLHGNYPYLNLFEGNIGQHIVIDDSHGKNGHHNTFFRNRAELYGIFMNTNPATDSLNFVGIEVTNNGILMGLYILNGSNHFQYGNNIKGTITPSGTGQLNDTSYYYLGLPSFWNIASNFPPIGPNNTFNTLLNPAKTRFLSGVELASCADTTTLTTIANKSVVENDLYIHNCGYNSNGFVFLEVFCKKDDVPLYIEVYTISGTTLVSMNIWPRAGLNKIDLPEIQKTNQPLVLIFRACQYNKVATKKMVLHY